jgi:hypothetical protein
VSYRSRELTADLELELVQWKSHLGIGKQRFKRFTSSTAVADRKVDIYDARTKWRHLEGDWKVNISR